MTIPKSIRLAVTHYIVGVCLYILTFFLVGASFVTSFSGGRHDWSESLALLGLISSAVWWFPTSLLLVLGEFDLWSRRLILIGLLHSTLLGFLLAAALRWLKSGEDHSAS